MKCTNHADADAVAECAGCAAAVCGECAVALDTGTWCRGCLAEATRGTRTAAPYRVTGRMLAAMLLSAIPGLGHMFLGLIGRGFALLSLLLAAVFLIILYSDSTGMYWMTAYLIPALYVLLVSFSVFDGREAAAGRTASDPIMRRIEERFLFDRRTTGFVVLVAGVLGILNLFAPPLNALLAAHLGVDSPVTALVLPAVLVGLGARLLFRGRRQR